MRILVVSSYGYWGHFDPRDLRNPKASTMIGGGETAMLSINRELAAMGHEVLSFYDTHRPGKYDGVDYLPTSSFISTVTTLEHDVLVAWDAAWAFRFADRARARILAFQLNDATIGPFHYAIDAYYHPSVWHARRFRQLYPEISKDKQVARVTNGVDMWRYNQQPWPERDPYRVLYTSSPDRGLHHLLKAWPLIKAAQPKANLHVYYDIERWLETCRKARADGFILNTSDRAFALEALMKDVAQMDVTFHGGVGQYELAQAQLGAHVAAYPCDPVAPTEGFSMSCLEALAAGCHLLTTNADALAELWQPVPHATILPLPVDADVWAEAVLHKFDLPSPGVQAPLDFTWQAIAQRWFKGLNL